MFSIITWHIESPSNIQAKEPFICISSEVTKCSLQHSRGDVWANYNFGAKVSLHIPHEIQIDFSFCFALYLHKDL